MNQSLSQPTAPVLPPEQVREDFFLAQSTDNVDPLWHYELAVRKSMRFEIPAKEAPGLERMMVLGRFFNADPEYAIEVFGQVWPFEIDAADFLDAWIEQRNAVTPMKVISRQPQPNPGGHVGDTIVTGGEDKGAWAARLICLKYGPRMMLFSYRTPLVNYNRLADDFFVSIMTTRMLDESPGGFAEKIRWIHATHPVTWKVAVPVSVEAKVGPLGVGVGEFEAEVIAETDAGKQPMGRLTYTMVAPQNVRDERHALENILVAFRAVGIKVESSEPEQLTAAEPYTGSWSYVAPCQLPSGGEGEMRVYILRHPNAWVLTAIVGVARSMNIPTWMRNKRLLDFVKLTTEIA